MLKPKRSIRWIAGFALVALFWGSSQFYRFAHTPLGIPESGQVVWVPNGSSVKKIAHQLYSEKIISSKFLWLLSVGYQRAWQDLKAGEYFLKAGTTPLILIKQLQKGQVIQHSLTIVPGWNFSRVLEEIRLNPYLSQTTLHLTDAEIMEKIGHPAEHPEGRFYPETYYFPRNTTDIAFLKRAYGLLQKHLSTVWEERPPDAFLKSPDEVLILASIIEKESSREDEYQEIAGVYIRRLQKKMRLQADPTVIYGMGKTFQGILTTQLLQLQNPYNTYQKRGLPPTPIAMPSLKALEAALHPREGKSLYFVAKGVAGEGHTFSETLEAHNQAVARYRKALQIKKGN